MVSRLTWIVPAKGVFTSTTSGLTAVMVPEKESPDLSRMVSGARAQSGREDCSAAAEEDGSILVPHDFSFGEQ